MPRFNKRRKIGKKDRVIVRLTRKPVRTHANNAVKKRKSLPRPSQKKRPIQDYRITARKNLLRLKYRIEALLFQSKQPMTKEQLSRQLRSELFMTSMALYELREDYAHRDSALTFSEGLSGWQFSIREGTVDSDPLSELNSLNICADDNGIPEAAHSRTSEAVSAPSSSTMTLMPSPLYKNRGLNEEFMDELNEKISAISHQSSNNSNERHLRERVVSEIDGLANTVPASWTLENRDI